MPASIHTGVIIPFGRVEFERERRTALTLEDLPRIVPECADELKGMSDPVETSHCICENLRRLSPLEGSHEHLFLLLYFDRVIQKLKSGAGLRDIFLPLPKTRFLIFGEQNSIDVDFAFWTGKQFVVVCIQETTLTRSRLAEECWLKLLGIDVFRLMADEFETRGLFGETGLSILDALGLRGNKSPGVKARKLED